MTSKTKENKTKSMPPYQSACDGDVDRFSIGLEDERVVPALARGAVEAFVSQRRIIEPTPALQASLLNQKLACFVSIKMLNGELRGCIGTIEPESNSLASEIISNAVKAATCDPRFLPVSETELPFLRYSVDVLESPVPARLDDLDPMTFGVIVVDERGLRRGLLLPAIEGIETVGQQVLIAARKAGIAPNEPQTLYRFRTRRFGETASTSNSSTEGQTASNSD